MNEKQAAEVERMERSAKLAIRALQSIAEVISEGGSASSNYLAERSGLSNEEWREAGGQLLASVVFFCHEHNFPEWHAETMIELESEHRE